MKKEMKLPKPVETYIRAINAHDADALQSSFAADAVVKDAGREICGIVAIKEWANQEIFTVNVTLDVIEVAQRDGQTIVRPHQPARSAPDGSLFHDRRRQDLGLNLSVGCKTT